MKAIDRHDQMLSYYSCEHKSIPWYKKVIFHIMQVLLVISFLLYNKCSPKNLTLYDFRLNPSTSWAQGSVSALASLQLYAGDGPARMNLAAAQLVGDVPTAEELVAVQAPQRRLHTAGSLTFIRGIGFLTRKQLANDRYQRRIAAIRSCLERLDSRKTDRQRWDTISMEKAIQAINNDEMGWFLASKAFNIPQSTLRRHALKQNKVSAPTKKGKGRYKNVFTYEMERELVEHIQLLETRLFGFTRKEVLELAYQLAEVNKHSS
ncbi:unnamed protein product [Leptidea sinapis]|uniref:HTH psq-type domain-containing protein n=1 Tax=Leptidea sinapis TaxID=189913 RepID=A0A5E4PMP4_9NEOP|nr:unnamed protein product [Leptidea sinapis]